MNDKLAEMAEKANKKLYGTFGCSYRSAVMDDMNEKVTEPDKYDVVEGDAIVFNQRTTIYEDKQTGWKLTEAVDPSALEKTDMKDVVFLVNHNDVMIPCARTRNKTLTITVLSDRVHFKALLLRDLDVAKQLSIAVKNGYLDRCSYGYMLGKDGLDIVQDDAKKEVVSTVRNIDRIFDFSAVGFPAYGGTSITSRWAFALDSDKAKLDSIETQKRMEQEEALKAEIRAMKL